MLLNSNKIFSSALIAFTGLMLLSAGAAAEQDVTGAYVLNSGEIGLDAPNTSGHVTPLGDADPFFSEIEFGFDIARDIELVQNETGFIQGYYLLDGYGGQHEIGSVEGYNVEQKPYFSWDIARDLEVVNTFQLVTEAVVGMGVDVQSVVTGQIGYYVVDGFGGVHPVNNTVDLPNRRSSNETNFKVFNDFPSSFPAPYNYPYFQGLDIIRDMEVSYVFKIVTDSGEEIVVGESNGYYMMDGYGGVHNAREDMDGQPLLAPWESVQGRPYFGWDIARDFEMTPAGDGYYILDGFGGVHTVNASLEFGSGLPVVPPNFGFDTAKDMEMVQGFSGSVSGYYVLTGEGTIYVLGDAPDLGQVVNFPGEAGNDVFRDMELSPLYTPIIMNQ